MREWKANWWERGNCRDIANPEVFITPRLAHKAVVDPWSEARKVCDGCPVKLECLQFVLAEEVRVAGHGGKFFAAGCTPSELRRLKRGLS